MEKIERIQWIDYLKAFTCFLVVLGHLLQSLTKIGIDNHYNITNTIDTIIYLFHMPLFMCISGYLYLKTKKEFSWKNYKKFEMKKIINLSIPYFIFYILFILINILFSSSVNNPRSFEDLINMFNSPLAPYWFLYALLSIFIIVPILEKIFKNNKKYVFLVFIILKLLSIFVKTNVYFIDSIMSWAIYFYLSIFFIKKEKQQNSNIFINIINSMIYIIFGIIYSVYFYKIPEYINEVIRLFFAIIGIYICINIFKNIKKSKILDTFKKYTFQIYLMHTIFAAGIRIILLKLGITNYYIHLIFGLLASIYIPVLISIISEKNKYTNFFFYPVKTIEEIKNRKED